MDLELELELDLMVVGRERVVDLRGRAEDVFAVGGDDMEGRRCWNGKFLTRGGNVLREVFCGRWKLLGHMPDLLTVDCMNDMRRLRLT